MKSIGTFVLAMLIGATAAHAQTTPDRTIDEIKVEAQARAERGAYPLIGLDPTDVREALANIKSRDRDEWAAGWSEVAQRYYKRAEASQSPEERRRNFLRAWRLYYFGQWPVAASEGKKTAYSKALDAFLRANEAMNPPLEVVRIPFEGKEIIGYLRLPSSDGPVPLVFAISGLDSRKENLAETYGVLLDRGIGFFTLDSPGTGQSPVKASPTADRVFSRVLDTLAQRKEIDPKRILVHGVSFGGYWASKLAITERTRLRGVVVQSPPIADFFSVHHIQTSLLGNREYLFDQVPAFFDVLEGATSVPELETVMPTLSLRAQGLLGKPTAPMLVIAGVKDTQTPISDIHLLLDNGDVPKDAWINPNGGHLGRERSGWTDPVIFEKIIAPWEIKMLLGPMPGGASERSTVR
jgi:esterase FrsA